MLATGEFVLAGDVVITPVARLSASFRRDAGAQPGDFALELRHGRAKAKIVDAATAALLEHFRTPTTVAHAAVSFGRAHAADPELTVRAAFPVLRDLVLHGFLVPATALAGGPVRPSLRDTQSLAGYQVLACLRVLSDTELYQVCDSHGKRGALKILGLRSDPLVAETFCREIGILEHLDGRPSPRLLATGSVEGRDFFISEWRTGVSPLDLATEIRRGDGSLQGGLGLLELCTRVAGAYAELHRRGIVHGDVHPGNILVDASGAVTVLDFGHARMPDGAGGAAAVPRAGVAHFFEPEYARAVLEGRDPPEATKASDQYAVAAVLWWMLTGTPYMAFSLKEDELLRQIALAAPRPFSPRGSPADEALERCLRKALAKNPEDRFDDMSSLSEALRSLSDGSTSPARPAASTRAHSTRLLRRVLGTLALDGRLLNDDPQTPPTASLNLGAGGIAYTLYRIACVRDDPELLAQSEVWLQRAKRLASRPDAFIDPPVGLTAELAGEVSIHHSLGGIHLLDALVAAAIGDTNRATWAASAFAAHSARPAPGLDVAFGSAGILLGTVLLLEAIPEPEAGEPDTLLNVGRSTADLIVRLASDESLADPAGPLNLGIAHGWAGVIYALCRWCEASRCEPPRLVETWLERLAGHTVERGRGVYWPWYDAARGGSEAQFMPGWCNGSAGFVHLWTEADMIYRDERFRALAERAAWASWESASAARNLCCGLAGRAYALLRYHQHSGETIWLHRARQLGERACEMPPVGEEQVYVNSLFKGDVGIALLAADLEEPANACMPLFGQA